MDILDVDLPPHDEHDDDGQELPAHQQQRSPRGDGDGSEHHVLLDSAAVAALAASAPLAEESGMSLHDDDNDDDDNEHNGDHGTLLRSDASGSHTDSNATGSKRRKIGKVLQLILLRKYVQCAKQLASLPTRATTEQLLEDAYDEFYLQGGSLSEPRLGYAAFLKLVRNRRGEVMRRPRDLHALSPGRGSRRHQKERLEIRSLIIELERVRQNHLRGPLDLEALDGSDDGSTTAAGSASSSATAALLGVDPCIAAAAASASHPHGAATAMASPSAVAGANDTVASYANAVAASSSSSLLLNGVAPTSDDVLVPRARLDMMLRFAQETLAAQKKILDEVRAIERRLDLHQL